MKYVIVGGVAGGATTAARLRRVDEDAEIIMLEKGPHISYANCGLPYYIGGVIKDRSKLLVQTPESFSARFNIDIRILSMVTAISPDAKTVEIKSMTTGEVYTETYDKLVLSPGASPLRPPIPGIDTPNIFTLRNVEDTDKIKGFVDDSAPKSAVVVGAGFIGLEMAENLHLQGVNVSVVEASSQVMNMMDEEVVAPLHQHFKEKNVALFLSDAVQSFEQVGEQMNVNLASGKTITTDFVILSIGVRPDTQLAKAAGIKIGKTGGVWVDEFLQTSAKDVYAVGDSIEFPHPITQQPSIAFLAGPANKQGRILADNMVMGHRKKYRGSIGTAIAKVFDLDAGITGMSDKALLAAGIPFESTMVTGSSHAGYYPGAMQMVLKINFDPESGRLFGGQIVGYDGVDKRLDLIASVIKNNGSIYDLMEIEHAYAPPFSSAKDPVNQAGFNAENIISGFFKPLLPKAFDALRKQADTFVLDVRTPAEHELGGVEGATNIEVDKLRERLSEVPKDKKILVYCAAGLRGYIASRILTQKGYTEVYNLSGGMKVYKAATAEQSNSFFFKGEELEAAASSSESTELLTSAQIAKHITEIDACGLQCPGPILKLKDTIDTLENGGQMVVKATDPGFYNDVASWCNVTGNKLLKRENSKGATVAVIEKSVKLPVLTDMPNIASDNKTMVVFSDDLDRALASFVIANGAASMGKKVTMFFTFWGLNVIKDATKPKVRKDVMGNMFDKMMPSNAGKLRLSNMNMGGIGRRMMKLRMKNKNVDALETMIIQAQESGINMIACQMSMDLMGVSKEELIDGVNIGGVANYLEEAEMSNMNLFV